MRSLSFAITLTLALGLASESMGGYGGLARHCLRRNACQAATCKDSCEMQCYTVMKNVTRTVYETVAEECQKTVYDTVWEPQTVTGMKRIPQVHYEEQPYTYMRKVIEPMTREVPYTTYRTICETRTRDITCVCYVPTYEKRMRTVAYTVWNPVCETRTRTVYCSVPRTIEYTKTICVKSGHWETRIEDCGKGKDGAQKSVQKPTTVCRRVWVPCVEYREVKCCKTVHDLHAQEVPYTVKRMVPQTCTREVACTVKRMMPVPNTRTVCYTVRRTVPEHCTRTVNYSVTRMVPETGCRTVPCTTFTEVPTTTTTCVPRQIPRTVCYTVTRCVPRTECYQVPVRVCVPMPKGGKKGKDVDIPAAPADPENPAPMPETPSVAMRLVSLDDGEEPGRTTSQRFAAALSRLHEGQTDAAVQGFRAAMQQYPGNAKYAYFCALAERQAGLLEQAEQTLAEATRLEALSPIDNWGQLMERVQGRQRIWIEEARSNAKH